MPVSHLLRLRARLAFAVGLIFLTGATVLSAPAGAQATPPAQTSPSADTADVLQALAKLTAADPVGRFESPLAALLSALYRAERGEVDGELTARDVAAKANRGCVDAGPADADVPTTIVAIFECRLTEAGVDEAHVKKWTAEALVVAECESLMKADIVVFNGKYLDTPHPNGNRYSAAGVFQFIRATAEDWIVGGYANVKDARLNIDAAARLFLHNRNAGLLGWDDWACAAAHDGFKVGSVLPGWPGGPTELPAWVNEYVS
jgi:hypothetical protein